MKYLRYVAGIVLGYAAMVLLITLVQEVWFGGVGWYKSSLPVLAAAGVLTFLAAVAGGTLATIIAGLGSKVPAAVMSGIVVLETIVLVVTGRVAGPFWFDAAGSASLILGIMIGCTLAVWFERAGRARNGTEALTQ